MSELTQILQAIKQGDPQAAAELLPRVYNELRSLAATRLAAEPPGQTLQATALVHEAYLRLVGNEPQRGWDGGGHFFAAAARAMRRILVDRARHKQRAVHGGRHQRRELESDIVPAIEPSEDLLTLHEALEKLAEQDPVKARLVELRFFTGLTAQEAAKVLGISATTADRHWAYARAWLRREMEQGGAGEKSEKNP